MNAREVNKKDRLVIRVRLWQKMKDHLDKKFPKMAMKDMESFKLLVQIFGAQMEDKEGEVKLRLDIISGI